MLLRQLTLQNFRSYNKANFSFEKNTTFIIGPNTAGKSNLIEAIFLLSTGRSFRAEKDVQMIAFGKEMARAKAEVSNISKVSEVSKEESIELEVVLTTGSVGGVDASLKKYLVNGISKRRMDFVGNLPVVLFSPLDLEIIVGTPGLRRNFLDDILEQSDREYRLAHNEYTKALRQRNALLYLARETGRRNDKQFEYWDEVLIKNGSLITKKREEFLEFINQAEKEIFECVVMYDKSIISHDRLLQYKDAELGAGVTLVGPHRDDFTILMNAKKSESVDVKMFGSRGQQRLVVLQLKLLQLQRMEKMLSQRPLLLLDDIFSELDNGHIQLVMEMINLQQTIITTTHKEFVDLQKKHTGDMIELKRNG